MDDDIGTMLLDECVDAFDVAHITDGEHTILGIFFVVVRSDIEQHEFVGAMLGELPRHVESEEARASSNHVRLTHLEPRKNMKPPAVFAGSF